MSLSGAKLGKLTEGDFRPCQTLQKHDRTGSSATVASAPDRIRLEPRATFHLADPVQFQEDFRASQVIDSTWPHQGNTVQVTVRDGTRRLNGVKCAFSRPTRREKPQGNKPIEESRWELSKHWHSSSLSPISVGRLIELTPRHACNEIWTRSQVVSTLGMVIKW